VTARGRNGHAADSPARLPVLLVSGPQSALREALIRQALAGEPAPHGWGLIRSPRLMAGGLDAIEAVQTQLGSCACCMGSAALLAAYGKLHRLHGPLSGLIIELDAQAHVCAMVDVLRSQALRSSGLVLHSVWHARSHWHSESDDERTRQMIATADRLWLADSQQLPDLAQYLGERYWNEAILAGGLSPPDWRLPRAGDGDLLNTAAAGCVDERWTRMACSDRGAWWRWCAPADRVISRPGVQTVLADLVRAIPVSAARGVFRTEREWYGWSLQGRWEPSFWRRDSRLDIFLAGDEPDRAWAQALKRCVD
jgi:hypothetical protein